MPKNHAFANEQVIPLSCLVDENFLILGQTTNPYYSVKELCREAGFEPKITYQGTRIDLILRMIEEGLGISLIMEKSLGSSLSDQLITCEITPTIESYLNYCVSEAVDAPASKEFLKYLQNNNSDLE